MVLLGCGESRQSATAPEAKPAEPVAEANKTEPPTPKAPDISIHDAAKDGNIKVVKQHLTAGADVKRRTQGDGFLCIMWDVEVTRKSPNYSFPMAQM